MNSLICDILCEDKVRFRKKNRRTNNSVNGNRAARLSTSTRSIEQVKKSSSYELKSKQRVNAGKCGRQAANLHFRPCFSSAPTHLHKRSSVITRHLSLLYCLAIDSSIGIFTVQTIAAKSRCLVRFWKAWDSCGPRVRSQPRCTKTGSGSVCPRVHVSGIERHQRYLNIDIDNIFELGLVFSNPS